ncbi:checkpoint clamp complex protein Rad1 [Rhodotorula kratochvilovae]
MPDVRPLASILRSVGFKQQATLKISEEGLVVTVEEGRSMQAHAYIARDAFSSYAFSLSASNPAAYIDAPAARASSASPALSSPSARSRSPSPPPQPLHSQMTVSLSTILECLNIFGNAGGGAGAGNPFKRDGGGGGGDREEDEGAAGGGGWRGRRRRMGSDDDEPRFARRGAQAGDEGKMTSLRMSYAGHGDPLVLLLEEGGIVTRCEITTYEPEGLLDLAFADEAKVQRLVIKSDGLRDALSELPPSSEKLTFSFSPPSAARGGASGRYGTLDRDEEEEVPLFRIESVGTLGSTEMDYTDDKDVLETFECEFPIRNTYKFSHIQLTKHALASAIKVSIRTDDAGLLSLQFMIPLSPRGAKASLAEGKIGFVEFLCVALDEDY